MKDLMIKNLSLFVTALALSPVCLGQSSIAGDWQGTLDADGTPFRVAWHVIAAPDGSFTSTLDNIDQSIFGIKVKSTTVKGSDVTVSVDDMIQANGQEINLRGDMVGTLSTDATEMTGTWTQTEPAQPSAPLHMKHQAAQAAAPPAGQTQIAGDWEGTLNAGPATLRLVLHIAATKDGALTATLDSVDQGSNGIPINAVTLKDSKLSLTVDAVHGSYEGTVNNDVSGINGAWTQGQSLELNLKRAQPQVAPKPGPPSDIDGTWMGMLDTGGPQLRILFKIVNMENGLSATMQSPDQSPAWVPASSITRNEGKLTITFKAFAVTYEGKVSADLKSVDGTFTQGGNEMPLVVKKI